MNAGRPASSSGRFKYPDCYIRRVGKLHAARLRSRLAGMRRLLLIAGLCAIGWASSPAPSHQNVLLVTIDTLRADRVGAWGYAAAHTPVLDRLAAGGTRFSDATAHAPLTYPAHA